MIASTAITSPPSPLPTMLCVDDHPRVVRQLEMLFRKDYDVTTATDPLQAKRLIADKQHFDVIISDMQMPGMTGVQLLRFAHDIDPTGGRILVTGFTAAEAVIDAKNEAGISSYVQKPWVNEDFRAKAEHASRLSRAAYQSTRLDFTQTLRDAGEGKMEQQRAKPPKVFFVGPHSAAHVYELKALSMNVDPQISTSIDDVLDALEEQRVIPDVMVCDLRLKEPDDRAAIEAFKNILPSVVVIILCDTQDVQDLAWLMNHVNPFRYLPTSITEKRFSDILEKAIRQAALIETHPVFTAAQTPQSNSELSTPLAARLRDVAKGWLHRSMGRAKELLTRKLGPDSRAYVAAPEGRYVGEFLGGTEQHVMQQTSPRSGVAHRRDALDPGEIHTGAHGAIVYRDGVGYINPDLPPTRSKKH